MQSPKKPPELFREKYHHQDDNNQIDIVIRRSFDQGRSWQPFQLVHTGSNATHQVTIGQGTPVLDHHTGRLWLFMTRNNSELRKIVILSRFAAVRLANPKSITISGVHDVSLVGLRMAHARQAALNATAVSAPARQLFP